MKNNAPAWIALVISLAALCFSALQWREAHDKFVLELKPSLNFTTNWDSDDPPIGISVDNSGPGPAVIKAIVYFRDKKPFGDCEKATAEFEDVRCFDFQEGDTMGVGDKIWLAYVNKPNRVKNQKEMNEFENMLDKTLAVQVEFCSVLGSCSKKCSVKDWCE